MLEKTKKKAISKLTKKDVAFLNSKGYKVIRINNKVIAIVKSI